MTATAFARRRAAVLERLDGGAVVLPAAPELTTGRDTEVRYVADAELYYLTGCAEPGAVAVLTAHEDGPFVLFVRPPDAEAERWTGPRLGAADAGARYGADTVYTLDQVEEKLPPLLHDAPRLFVRLDSLRGRLEETVRESLRRARGQKQRSGKGPDTVVDPGAILDDLRIVKDDDEIHRIRQVVEITVRTFPEALARAGDGRGEWEVEAAMEAGFRSRGADAYAFPTIAASGPNATVLHYGANQRTMHDGELLLVDAGARLNHYNADITRTVPVGGSASPPGRDVLDAVHAARTAAIDALRPGATIADVHDAARRVLATAMLDLGLAQGSLDELLEDEEKTKPYFPHRTSHWLGLDVHDVGGYTLHGEPRPLQAGMVLTVEPGLYIPTDDQNAPDELRGIGARLEDDVLVTDDGCENLSEGLS